MNSIKHTFEGNIVMRKEDTYMSESIKTLLLILAILIVVLGKKKR